MSTASPLPLQPLPPSTVSEAEARALRQEISSRLAEHRQRRPRAAEAQETPSASMPVRRSSVADQVAARFAQSVSYRDFLQQEAEAAIRQAEAAAEVARRSAEAITAAQQQLLDEIDQWHGDGPSQTGPGELIEFSAPSVSNNTSETGGLLAIAEPVVTETSHAQDAVEVSATTHAETVTVQTTAIAEVVTAEPEATPSVMTFTMPSEPLEPSVAIPANLIEFPRQLVATRRARPRLAEGPLRDEADATPERAQLRIFEVEASSVSTEPLAATVVPDWHNIRIDIHDQPRTAELPESQISFAIPLYVAPVSQRAMAVAVDACCITLAFLAAVAVAAYASPVLPTGIPAAITAAGTLFAFSLLYQVLFFSLSESTPGMRYARIAYCTFSDENPTRKALLRRIGALLLAAMPLGLGLLWTAMDEEKLGWHDRISRMYPRAY